MSKHYSIIVAAAAALTPLALSASVPDLAAFSGGLRWGHATPDAVKSTGTVNLDAFEQAYKAVREGNPSVFEAVSADPGDAGTREFKLSDVQFKRGKVSSPKKDMQKAPFKLKQGYYICKDWLLSQEGSFESFAMQYVERNDSVLMINMFGVGTSVYLEEEEAMWSIPAQKLFTYSSLGDMYVVPVNPANNSFDPEGKISVVVDSKGNAKLTPWAVLCIEGANAGRGFGGYSKSEWLASNASVKITDIGDNVYTYPMYVEQNYPNRLNFYNLVGRGGYIEATVTPSKTLKITPQFMLNNMMYGDAFCYAADWTTNKVNTAACITGKATTTGFELDDWAIAFRSSPQTSILQAQKTEITSSFAVNYPDPVGGEFDGAGTQASPWQLKNADDMYRLSERVAAGENFAGKWFSLENDIDMAAGKLAWNPIGDATTPFEATLIGNGHAIKNLKGNGRGENYYALFGYLGSKSTVEKLKLQDVALSGTGDQVGGIAAWSEGVIKGCTVSGSVNGQGNMAGAIAAVNAGTIDGCSVSGSVAGAGNIGSISGQCYGTITGCSSSATVRMTAYISSLYHCVGGLVGMVSPLKTSAATITDSYFCGGLSDAAGYGSLGGVAGAMVVGRMERCMNTGIVTGTRVSPDTDTPTGGIVGMINESVINDCLNAGTVIKNQTSDFVGGIIGYLSCSFLGTEVSSKSTVTNCINVAYISSSSTSEDKGILGSTFVLNGINPADQMISNCWFDSQITGLDSEKYGKPSSAFTSGNMPAGFSSDVWTARQGRYPMLNELDGTEAAFLASAFMQLSDNETARKVKKTIKLNSDSPVQWSLLKNGNLVTSTDALKLEGTNVSIGSDYGNETLVAMIPSGSMKAFYLSAVPKVFDGEGTEQSPYLVKSKADFAMLHRAVGTFAQGHIGDYFSMTSDIDFGSASDFNGVGVGSSYSFGGVFDGGGHSLHKLSIKTAAYDGIGHATPKGSFNYGGLFAVLGKTAVVKNVNVAADCKFDFWGLSGAIAGYNSGRIENCRNYADMTAIYQYAGGIAGVNNSDASIEGCYNAGRIHVGYEYAGGIVGQNLGAVSLCQNDGEVIAAHLNPFVTSDVKSGAGGIAALNYGSLDNCVNNATVTATRYVGGLIGTNSASQRLGSVSRCINNGIVVCLADADTRGGIMGNVLSRGEMTDTYYDASVNPIGAANNIGVRGLNGVSTSKLTSGNALAGLDAAVWDFASGKYPVLKRFASEESGANLRQMFVAFADGEIRTNVINSVNLSSPQGIAWSLVENKNFKISGNRLDVEQPTELVVATDTLTARLGKYVKVYDLRSIPNVLDGRGTEEVPFLIRTTDDFNKLSNFIESSKMDYNGFFFRLENDLDFTDKEFRPIALGKLKFQGDFNGNGKTIKGFAFDDTSINTGRQVGFFGTLGEASFVHDLTLNGSIRANGYAGGFAANLYGKIDNCVNLSSVSVTAMSNVAGFVSNAHEDAEITNCVNKGKISGEGRNYAAGIVAEGVKATITDCINEGEVFASSYIGGIAAKFSGTITGCVNKGLLRTNKTLGYIAGIVAYGAKEKLTVTGCRNEADITSVGNYVAGIVCYTDKYSVSNGTPVPGCFVEMTDCSNSGKLSAPAYVAGIAYSLEGGVRASGCVNTADLNVTGTGYCAGLFGVLDDDAREENYVNDCHNEGNITSTGRYNGGFGVTINSGIKIFDCYNLGNITTTYTGSSSNQTFTGGFSANLSGSAERCWNAGNVTSSHFGISGFSSYGSGTIDGCVNLGDVTCTGTVAPGANFGGAAGFWSQGQNTLINSVNYGKITSVMQAAGLHSAAWNGTKISGCYNAGDVVVTGSSLTKSDVLISRRPNVLDGETLISNNYVLAEAISSSSIPNSMKATALSHKQLRSAELGDAFIYDRAALPVPAAIAVPAYVHFAAAAYDFENGNDTENNVTGPIHIPALAGLEWSVDNGAAIRGNRILTANTGNTRVTCRAEGTDLEKHFDFVVTEASSVDTIDAGREVIAREYYDLAGHRLAEPLRGAVTIVVSHYAGGTVETRRIIITE